MIESMLRLGCTFAASSAVFDSAIVVHVILFAV